MKVAFFLLNADENVSEFQESLRKMSRCLVICRTIIIQLWNFRKILEMSSLIILNFFFQFIFQPTPSARTLPLRTHAVTQQVFAPMTNDLTENAIRTVPKNTLTSQERKMYENTSESVAATTAATSSALFPHLAEAQITSAQIWVDSPSRIEKCKLPFEFTYKCQAQPCCRCQWSCGCFLFLSCVCVLLFLELIVRKCWKVTKQGRPRFSLVALTADAIDWMI